MGLIDRLKKSKSAEMEADVPALLLAAMIGILYTDDKDQDEQDSDLLALFKIASQVPELRGIATAELGERMNKGIMARTKINIASLSEHLRKRIFVMATEIALYSGDISDEEDEALGELAVVLKINNETAQMVIDVMAMKYVG